MKQQDSEQASDHDMPEDDKERMPEKYETVSLDDFVKYNIMKENIDFYGKSGFRQASEYGIRYHGLPEGEDASFFLCKELIPGFLDGITGELFKHHQNGITRHAHGAKKLAVQSRKNL